MKIFCIIGTRPEVIKLAPVIIELKKSYDVTVISTGQHKSMLTQTLNVFNICPDIDLQLMQEDQRMTDILATAVKHLSDIFVKDKPNLVLGQGDTITALSAALASYFNKVPFGHIEAGLRSYDYNNPWPEEMNRQLISKMSTYHFCPTESAVINLKNEGITENIFMTGNTVIDSLYMIANKKNKDKKQILVTIHRRENFGLPIENILNAIQKLVEIHLDIEIIFPVHLNPNVRNMVYSKLNHERIKLIEPLDYKDFVEVMNESYLILTDSGGIQEEAPALGIPVLVLREITERPEAVNLGVVKLVGSDSTKIIYETSKLLTDITEYKKMAKGISPYGDGKASKRIFDIIKTYV